MLVPDPKVVRRLLTQYATLQIAQAERHSPVAARELEDVSYTLCVMMGTSAVHDAIARADALLGLTPPAPGRAAEADGENDLSLAV
ncbi:hypothetical protein BU52_04535 [Streptomyces toyocaensis]|uniref:Methionine ABC transporter ATP-binding protein n=1 Tax=Streptomyces toyocaensis TaxID=55952 RepID=A0A081XXM2_STRTO|nr:DUF5133 domain-containing protein [Streptomyces toyocaensis]KES08295.1 hypothetical protein BU52_04535 [Streptomyces toyocaensis]